MKEGKVIVVEGACDGIGKSTQFSKLCQHLKEDGVQIVNHHFPTYNTYQGLPVEKYLAGEYGTPKELSPYFINSLYAQDRAITWHTILKSEYQKGKFVLLDRYTTSSIIYQSALMDSLKEKREFIDYIIDFEYNKLGIQQPEHVIFLHAPFDLVTEMRKNRKANDGIQNDIHERNLDFMKKVYESSLFASEYLGWDKIECSSNDSMKSIDEIHDEVYDLVKSKKLKI